MFTIILVIFAIGVFVGIASRRGDTQDTSPLSPKEFDEVSRLNERVSVLERLQTDEDYALRQQFKRFRD
ncbi:MAG: hypothetical protein Hens3KO_16430 [Henriciella sp.]